MLKKTISTCVLLGVCCAPLLAVAQQDNRNGDYAQQQRNDDRAQQQRGDDRGQSQYDRGQSQYVQHNEWKRGYHMNHDDWNRGQPVDYRANHLQRPRPGYEWRQIDGNYVMANS